MKYLVALVFCVMSFTGIAANQSGSSYKSVPAVEAGLKSDVLKNTGDVNKHSYEFKVLKGDDVIWSDIISESHNEAHQPVGKVVFVAGTAMSKSKCADLFVGTVTFGDIITMRSDDLEIEVPGDETYTGICSKLDVGKEATSVFLSYKVIVKRLM